LRDAKREASFKNLTLLYAANGKWGKKNKNLCGEGLVDYVNKGMAGRFFGWQNAEIARNPHKTGRFLQNRNRNSIGWAIIHLISQIQY
jgi:hypothetical protein